MIPPDFPPTYFRDEATGQAAGFSVDVLNEVARRAGFAVEYVFAESWDLMEQSVLTEKADLIPILTIDEKRLKSMIFTSPVETLKISLIARASDTAHNRIESGMTIGVMKGSSVDHRLSLRTDISRHPYASLEPLLLDLLASRFDLAMTAAPNILKIARESGIEDRIRIIEPCEYEAKRGMALRPGNEALRDRLNSVIEDFVPTMAYQKIYQKWWGKSAPFWNTKRVALTIAWVTAVLVAIFLGLYFRERRRSTEELQKSDQQYRQFVETANGGVWAVDAAARTTYVNRHMAEILGYSSEEMIGKTIDSFMFEADIPDHEARMVQRKLGHPDEFERRYRHKNGSEVWTQISATAVMDTKGRFAGSHAFLTNITERKRVEEALREREKRFRLIAETITEVFWIADRHVSTIYYISPGYERVWGRSTASLYENPRSFMDALHEADRGTILPDLTTKKELKPFEHQYRIVKPNGDIRWIWDRGFPIPDETGIAARYVGIAQDITEYKEIEENLRHTKDYLENLISNANAPIIVWDAEFRITKFNQASERLSGLTALEALGEKIDLLFPTGTREQSLEYIKRASAGDRWDAVEIEVRHADGTIFTLLWNSAAVYSTDGETVLATIAQGQDITERKQIEKMQAFLAQTGSATKGETFFHRLARFLAENLGMDFVCIDRLVGDGLTARTVAVWSDGHFEDNVSYALKDTPCGEVVGKTICCFPANVSRLFPHDLVLQDLRAESYVGVTLFGHAGRPIGLIAVIGHHPLGRHGLAETMLKLVAVRAAAELERLDAEESLRKNEALFRGYFDLGLIGMAVTSLEKGWVQFNDCLCEMLGYSRGELSKMTWAELTHPGDLAADEAQFAQVISGKIDAYRIEKRFIGKDGSVLYADLSVRCVRGEDGHVDHFLAMIQDITGRKQTEERLLQAQKLESIGTLAGGIAHDFNNILYPLLGFTELLKEDIPADSPLQAHIDEILRAALRSKDLVKQILAFSRKGDQRAKPIQLHPIVKEALALLRSSIPTSIDIRQEIDSHCGIVMADPTQIHQIVMNLSTNAYHAMENTAGRLQVSLKQIAFEKESDPSVLQELVPGNYALLTISDTGTGIPKNILNRIFDPYFTTKGVGKGTGLGLSVVQGIVKAHKGDIHITSAPGVGTQVRVYLPIIEQPVENKPIEKTEPLPGGTERILLVDDERPIVQVERRMLEKLGYQVTTRTSSLEALAAFETNPTAFDLVLTDMTMPHMTGTTLAKKLIAIRPDTPILLCTGYSEKTEMTDGIAACLIKPVVLSEMARVVRKVLDEAIAARSNGPTSADVS